MSNDTVKTLRKHVDSDRIWPHVQWCADVPRDTGRVGEDSMVAYIVSQLDKDGVPVTVHEFDAYLSFPRQATLTIPGGEQLRCVTHPFTHSTDPGTVRAPLVAATGESLAAAKGKVALVEGVSSPLTILRASQIGVAGLIFANPGPWIHNMVGTTIWGGSPMLDEIDRLPTIPVVSINNEDGEKLQALLKGTKAPEVTLLTKVDTGWTPTKLPEVVIPGTEEPEKFVLVGGHYCAWHVGITDNATGTSALMEMARILWHHRHLLKRSVRIAWWPGHSHGRYAGSTWYADTFFQDLAKNCILYHNVDSPGVRGATQYLVRHTTAEAQGVGQQLIAQFQNQPDAPIHRPSLSADQSFLSNGVASCSLYSFLPEDHPDRRLWTGGSGGGWWWHSEFDTLDKADPDILADDCRLSLSLIATVCNADVLPLDVTACAADYAAMLARIRPVMEQHCNLQPLSEAIATLQSKTAWLKEQTSQSTNPVRQQAINDLLLRLGRVLNPVVYCSTSRFVFEPADLTPVQRNRMSVLFPGLSKAALLPDLQGTPDHGFLVTQLRRQINRTVDAVEQANALIDCLAR